MTFRSLIADRAEKLYSYLVLLDQKHERSLTHLEKLMSTTQDIFNDLTSTKSAVDGLVTAFKTVEANTAALTAQVASLQAQLASGVAVSQTDLDSIDAGIKAIQAEASAAVAKS